MSTELSTEGIVFHIQHFTIHDGPGIRTEVFLKGCPLRCAWCSNPEGLDREIRPGVYRKKCLGRKVCGRCLAACPKEKDAAADTGAAPNHPLIFSRNRLVRIDHDHCASCMACADACPAEAVRAWGQRMTAEEVMAEIRRDRGYYDRSGGGVTVSGGEPLLQADFVADLLGRCRAEGIHTCCESSLCIPWERVEKVLPVTDLWIADLKLMDPALHREWTGQSNRQILDNLKRLAECIGSARAGAATAAAATSDQMGAGRTNGSDPGLILRIPVIPGVNDNEENMAASADFILRDLGGQIRTLQLLSYMRLGMEKYESLGMSYPMTEHLKRVRFRRDHFQKKVEGFAAYFRSRGIHALVGTREKG